MLRLLRGAALVSGALATTLSAAVQVKDDRAVVVNLPARPARIIALSPHLTEIVFAAGAGGQLAAVVRYSDYPEAARRLPQVGDASRIDLERVMALKPDLILGWQSGNPAGDLERLERLGFRVFVSEPRTLSDIARLVRTVGTFAGSTATANAAAAHFERDLAALRGRYSTQAPVRVFYEIWHRPLLTVNGAHLISDVIALCGGTNVFAGAAMLTPSVSIEAVLASRPEVIIGGSSAIRPHELASEWQRTRIAALREIPVRYVPADLIQRQTLRIAQGAALVCEYLAGVRAHRVRP
ncbi:MAG: substrate-binding periplasmic transporter protein [Betaproteobacteria bacterium]|nr:substrate-binding periplasmic transporter protein [Betaproteobacteria bacterium]MEA3152924.1 iron complex transport system substrate-binding protein [Betaproteobacteria bacterium]